MGVPSPSIYDSDRTRSSRSLPLVVWYAESRSVIERARMGDAGTDGRTGGEAERRRRG
jgi:hypothetical protein